MGLVGLRPAPIQVSWKNFVASLGADGYVGHLVGDAIVTPPELQGFYSERLLLLPVIRRTLAPFLPPRGNHEKDALVTPPEGSKH